MRLKLYLLLISFFVGTFFISHHALAATDACTVSTPFSVILKNVDGTGATKLNVELYTADYDNGDINKPLVGKKVMSGTTDTTGKWVTKFTPTRGLRYIIKIYDKNTDNGDFWYFDQQLSCGSDFELKQTMPRVTIILRDSKGNLVKDADVSVYSLHTDVDGNPIADRTYLVSSSKPSTQGSLSFYLAPNIKELSDKTGAYFVQVKRNNQTFNFPKVRAGNSDITYNYSLSGLDLNVKLATGKPLGNATVNIYQQNSDLSLGTKLYSTKTNTAGQVAFEYPAGIYAFSVVDDYKQENVFNNVVVADSGITTKTLTTNYTKFYLASVTSDTKSSINRNFQIYSLTASSDGSYYKNKSVGNLTMTNGSETTVSLAAGPYLVVYKVGDQEYGTAFMATNDQQKVALKISGTGINSDNAITLKTTETTAPLIGPTAPAVTKTTTKVATSKLNGYMVLVNGDGGLWYIKDNKRFRLDGNNTYDLVKSFSTGISNSDLIKIPVGIAGMYGLDTDKDGLSDSLEVALGINANKADSDGDKFSDLTEVKSNFNPLGKGSLKIDKTFASKQKGRLFSQVKNQKQLWYVSPRDAKRYFLFDSENIAKAIGKIAVSVNWSDIAYLPAGN